MNDLMELVNDCAYLTPPNVLKTVKGRDAHDIAAELGVLGFKKAAENVVKKVVPIVKLAEIAAHKFIEITPDKIKAFLQRKADTYNKEYKEWMKSSVTSSAYSMMESPGGVIAAQALSGMAQQALGAAGLYGYGTVTINTTTNPSWWGGQSGTYYPDAIFTADTKHRQSTKKGTIGRFEWTEVAVKDYEGIPPANVLERFAEVKKKNLFDYFTIASVNAVKDPLLLGRVKDHESRFFCAQWGDDVSLDEII